MSLQRRRQLLAALGAGFAFGLSTHADAADLTLQHVDRGAINSPTVIATGQPVKVVSGSHQTRHIGDGAANVAATRSYFTFDLSAVTGTIAAARLRISHPNNSYDSPDAAETVVLYEVITDASVLQALPSNSPNGDPGGAIFDDLGSGPEYGEFEAALSDNGTVESIELNAAAVADFNSVRGTPERWSTGLEIISASATGLGSSERVFRGSSSSSPAAELVLTLEDVAAVPLLGNGGRWGLWALLCGAGVVALRPLGRRRDTDPSS